MTAAASAREPRFDPTPPPVPPNWPILLARLEVGQSLIVDRLDEGALRAAMTRYHRRSEARFTARVMDAANVRCWRIA
jgi:hypothetical protein